MLENGHSHCSPCRRTALPDTLSPPPSLPAALTFRGTHHHLHHHHHYRPLEHVLFRSGGESSRSVGGALDNVIIVANKADLAVDLPPPPPHRQQPQQPDADAIALQALAAAAATAEYPSSEIVENQGKEEGRRRQSLWRVSCKTKEGLDVFMGHLEAEVRSRFQGAEDDESPLITRWVIIKRIVKRGPLLPGVVARW